MTPETITIARTGDRPLQFTGALIIAAEAWTGDRGHTLTLYQHPAGFVVTVEYQTNYDHEPYHCAAYTGATIADIAAALQAHDPLVHFRGFPAHRDYREKQARLAANLTASYHAAVSELLADFPETLEA